MTDQRNRVDAMWTSIKKLAALVLVLLPYLLLMQPATLLDCTFRPGLS